MDGGTQGHRDPETLSKLVPPDDVSPNIESLTYFLQCINVVHRWNSDRNDFFPSSTQSPTHLSNSRFYCNSQLLFILSSSVEAKNNTLQIKDPPLELLIGYFPGK